MSFAALSWAWESETGSPGRKLVLIGLAQFTNDANDAWPSQKTLSKRTEQSERTVREHLSWLEKNGFITSTHRFLTDGTRTSDCYSLNIAHRQIQPPAIFATGEKPQENTFDHRQISPPNIQLNTNIQRDNKKVSQNAEKQDYKITFDTFVKNCKDQQEDAILDSDSVYRFAESAGIPDDYITLAWFVFRCMFTGDKLKKQAGVKGWRQAFKNYVQNDYLKLWAFNKDGDIFLTTKGKQYWQAWSDAK